MDLYAYQLSKCVECGKYIDENYGEIPRIRGIRFMKVAKKWEGNDLESEMFNKYVGTDTIYIHTRCGDCGLGYDDEYSNYVSCGAKEWEEKHKDLFLDHITEEFDCTYCTHYFKAVVNEDYENILKQLKNEGENENV